GFRKSKPVDFLLALASHVRSINLVQDLPCVCEIMHPPNWIRSGYVYGEDWSALIIEMFSRKVDTLQLNSLNIPGNEIVDELLQVRALLYYIKYNFIL
ncbi:hypothetical protein PMAYCL1PPCAC_27337, partial [Pristionchus mayeri]